MRRAALTGAICLTLLAGCAAQRQEVKSIGRSVESVGLYLRGGYKPEGLTNLSQTSEAEGRKRVVATLTDVDTSYVVEAAYEGNQNIVIAVTEQGKNTLLYKPNNNACFNHDIGVEAGKRQCRRLIEDVRDFFYAQKR